MSMVLAISLLASATAAAAQGVFSGAWDYLSRLHQEADPAYHPFQALWSLSHLAGLASPWAERAREELRAAGIASYARAPALWNSLSAQERQVARMVAEGLSNRQIAERLYLSHRTASSHLYRIFPKLGITSRARLTAMSLDLPSESRRLAWLDGEP